MLKGACVYKPYSDATFRKYIDMLAAAVCRYFPKNITPLHCTFIGFVAGVSSMLCTACGYFMAALFFFFINRVCDVLDGVLSHMRKCNSDKGAFFDIVCDFTIYSLLVLGFGFYSEQNALTAALVLCSFMVTASAFLAFSIFVKKEDILKSVYNKKNMYYMTGLVEGTETVLFFLVLFVFPEYFVWIGTCFAIACFYTGVQRMYVAYNVLQ